MASRYCYLLKLLKFLVKTRPDKSIHRFEGHEGKVNLFFISFSFFFFKVNHFERLWGRYGPVYKGWASQYPAFKSSKTVDDPSSISLVIFYPCKLILFLLDSFEGKSSSPQVQPLPPTTYLLDKIFQSSTWHKTPFGENFLTLLIFCRLVYAFSLF